MSEEQFSLIIEVDRKSLSKSLTLASNTLGTAADKMSKNAMKISDTITMNTNKAINQQTKNTQKLGTETQKAGRKMQGAGQRMSIGLSGVVEAFDKLGGFASSVFEKMISASPEASAAIEEMSFQTDLLFMSFGDTLAPMLEKVADLFIRVTDVIMSFPEPVQTAIATTIAFIAVGAKVVSILGAVVGAINPVTLAIIGIAAAVSVLAVAWENDWNGIQGKTFSVIEVLKPVFEDFITRLIDGFANLFESISPLLVDLMDIFGELAISFAEMWVTIKPIVDVIMEHLFDRLQFGITILIEGFKLLLKNIKSTFDIVTSLVKGDWTGAWEAFTSIFENYAEFFQKIWASFWDIFGDTIERGLGFAFDLWENFTDVMSKVGDKLFDVLIQPFIDLWDGIKQIGQDIFNFFENLFGKVGDFGGIMGDFLKSVINVPINFINDVVIGSINTILDAIASLLDLIPDVDKPSWSIPNIPTLHTGGIFRAPTPGGEGLALLKDQERVLSPQESLIFGRTSNIGPDMGGRGSTMMAAATSQGNTVNSGTTIVNIHNPQFSNQGQMDKFRNNLQQRDYESLRRDSYSSR
jgi:hypothetical protein